MTDRGKNMRVGLGLALALAISAGLLNIASAPAEANGLGAECTTVDVVFARGSGQDVGGPEAERFRTQIESRLSTPVTMNPYELGSTSIEGHQFPAVAVAGDWDVVNGIGAGLSGGGGFAYGSSVDEGVDELHGYITGRLAECPDSRFILGGYSQGAQVIGETYVERLTDAQRAHVVFAAHFGDPKLYLPEGESVLWWEAPACRGEDFSEWRRVVPNCDTDDGSLGARNPYLPASWTSDVGLWCADKDFVCGSSKMVGEISGHETYALEGGDIDHAALEAIVRLQYLMPEHEGSLDVTEYTLRTGLTGLDVVFFIDSTGSMGSRIAQAKSIAASMTDRVVAQRGRVALVEYRDAGDSFTARVLSDLQEDTTDFLTKLNSISVGGGGDAPEALLHALKTGMEGVNWRPGATKAAVVLTDAGYHDPDLVDGATLDSIAELSLSIDPVNVYPVVPSYLAAEYQPLAEATTGEVVLQTSDAAVGLEAAITKIQNRPVPQLALNGYHGPVGTTVTFDGSSSYSATSTIERWDWDFDGDGVYETLDGGPVESHLYDGELDGFVQLRVTDADGLVANVSAPVQIGAPPAPSTIPADSAAVSVQGTTATFTWQASVNPTKAWSISVDGVQVGLIEPAARSVQITDVVLDEPVEFGVAPLSSANELGLTVTATAVAEGESYNLTVENSNAHPDHVGLIMSGRAVPIEFSLGGDYGLDVLAVGSPTTATAGCWWQIVDGQIVAQTFYTVKPWTKPATSRLTYDAATGNYTYEWKTPSTTGESCQRLTLTFKDGSQIQALYLVQ